jgi:hypothetical protein
MGETSTVVTATVVAGMATVTVFTDGGITATATVAGGMATATVAGGTTATATGTGGTTATAIVVTAGGTTVGDGDTLKPISSRYGSRDLPDLILGHVW